MNREVLEVAAQAIERQFGGAKPDPFPAAQDAGGPRHGAGGARDGNLDEAAEVPPVRPFIDIDEDCERMGRA